MYTSSHFILASPCDFGTLHTGVAVEEAFDKKFFFRHLASFKKSSCQLVAKECMLSTGKWSLWLAQEQCG